MITRVSRTYCSRCFAAAAAFLVVRAASGQVEPRVVAIDGHPVQSDLPAWETVIAAGGDRAVAISNVGWKNGTAPNHSRIMYATGERVGGAWSWTDQGVFGNDLVRAIDPLIVYNSQTNQFAAFCLINDFPVMATWNPGGVLRSPPVGIHSMFSPLCHPTGIAPQSRLAR